MKAKPRNILPDSELTCFVVPQALSEEACEALLSDDVKNAFQPALPNYPAHYRNNDRLVVDSEALGKELFQKVKPYLPEAIEAGPDADSGDGHWRLEGLNSRIRFCRYSVGQFFGRHLDGAFHQDEATQSKLTFMIYLNDAADFRGGRTLFSRDRQTADVWASHTPQRARLSQDTWARSGRCASSTM